MFNFVEYFFAFKLKNDKIPIRYPLLIFVHRRLGKLRHYSTWCPAIDHVNFWVDHVI